VTSSQNARRLMGLLSVAAISFAGLIATGLIILALRWPFSTSTVSESLQQIIPGTVQIAKFQSTYFPHPGCIAEGVVLVRASSASGTPPLVTVQRISIQANYLDLFLRPGYIARIVLNGLRVHVPTRGSGANRETNSAAQSGSISMKTRVGEIIADSAVLEVARHGDKRPLNFAIHLLTLNSVTRDKPFSYRVALTNALPPGEIVSGGQLGPWNSRALGETSVSGSVTFQQANLGVFRGIAGTLSSEDSFEGALGHIDIHGKIVRKQLAKLHTARIFVQRRKNADLQDSGLIYDIGDGVALFTSQISVVTCSDRDRGFRPCVETQPAITS
jgi:hypothetical protein